MNNRSSTVFVVALAFFFAGCAAPTQKVLDRTPNWKKAAQRLASEAPCDGSGLVWQPFPDLDNPLHRQIWNALWKRKNVGYGFGRICNYYGFYLVTVPDFDSTESFFYDPKSHFVFTAFEGNAFSLYRGNREATPTNTIALVRHVLAVDGYQALVVSNSTDIPHTIFTKDNPGLSFKNWLFSKGILITPPTLIKRNEHTEVTGFSEYNVFVYMPVGGQLFRYEVRCRNGRISELMRYLIGSDIGDAWHLM